MVKKFISVIVCLAFLMVSCEKEEEATTKVTYITGWAWKNVIEMERELVDRGSISSILDENIIDEKNNAASDDIDYEDYLNKIWVLDRWSEENVELDLYEEYSFSISEIKNHEIQGAATRWGIINPREDKPNFRGTIENRIGECQFDMGDGYKGKFQFEIVNTNEIMVEFKYTYSDDMEKMIVYERKGIFKPYNLSMVEEVTVAKTMETDLDLWGTVWLAIGWYDTSTRHLGAAYLINEEGDILYRFHAPFRTGMWIVDAQVEDLNGDGLSDIKMMERDQDGLPDVEEAADSELQEGDYEWHFIQKEDGSFERGLLIFG